jgi:hypothetical protein
MRFLLRSKSVDSSRHCALFFARVTQTVAQNLRGKFETDSRQGGSIELLNAGISSAFA